MSTAEAPEPAIDTSVLLLGFKEVLAAHRKIIVLLADEAAMASNERALANEVGQGLFHENRQRVVNLESQLESLASSTNPQRMATLICLTPTAWLSGRSCAACKRQWRAIRRYPLSSCTNA